MHSRYTRRVAAGLGVAAVISMGTLTACGGSGSNGPSSTETTTTTTATTSASTPAPSVSPTEKNINPSGGNSFSPAIKAPPAPTGMPGTNHTG
ncbi:hypothetical protein MMAD_03130 [Mycolicibacterium madagascariense]|uniref:Lipoprotein n=2 Tax=Mycolicibacterium madagascariense TaxID=212765 RepID=A0A7I7XCB5_9MYCO|nr:hypothetical protein [Mycolicibacterium madagascariense]MCV7010781.1 hypothetical protein [Mycolicibacterium madagascariense]BBZ26018.1 hypothetical protein MMAD_03130 [Mycolicibacterium madagascariense]